MKRKSLFALSAVVVAAAAALVPVLWSGGDNLHNGSAVAATPEEIADAIVFVASDTPSFITGEIIRINGGKTAS